MSVGLTLLPATGRPLPGLSDAECGVLEAGGGSVTELFGLSYAKSAAGSPYCTYE